MAAFVDLALSSTVGATAVVLAFFGALLPNLLRTFVT